MSDLSGVYCLANDGVVEWCHVMFSTLREHEPDLPVYIIPFDDRVERLSKLVDRYGFEWFAPESLTDFDRLGQRFHPEKYVAQHAFRKLAMFDGPLEAFLFLDADIAVLDEVSPMFRVFRDSDADLLAFDIDMDQVYESGPLRDRMMARGARGFNTGAFISRAGVISRDRIMNLADEVMPMRNQLCPRTLEQPFLNYCFDREGRSVVLARDIADGLAEMSWARQSLWRDSGGIWRSESEGRLLFIHWAGFGLSPSMPNSELFATLRRRSSESLLGGVAWTARWWLDFLIERFGRFGAAVLRRLGRIVRLG